MNMRSNKIRPDYQCVFIQICLKYEFKFQLGFVLKLDVKFKRKSELKCDFKYKLISGDKKIFEKKFSLFIHTSYH